MTRRKDHRTRALFGTKQVAEFLGIPEWRVKNFSEGEAYRLPPSVQVGAGKGSRRLYTFQDLLRIAIADELVRCGFTPEKVGQAVHEVPESMLTSWEAWGWQKPKPGRLPLLVCVRGKWQVLKATEVEKLLRKPLGYHGHWSGVFVLNFQYLLYSRVAEMEEKARVSGKED